MEKRKVLLGMIYRRRDLLQFAQEQGLALPHFRACNEDSDCRVYGTGWIQECSLLGHTFEVTIPACRCYGNRSRDLAEFLSTLLKVDIIHRVDLERTLRHCGQHDRAPSVRFPEVFSLHPTHPYYCLRDITRLVDRVENRCPICRRRRGLFRGVMVAFLNRRDLPVVAKIEWTAIQVCSVQCRDLCLERDLAARRVYERARKQYKKELKWIRKGKAQLKELRSLTVTPSRLEALQSQTKVSEPGASLPLS